ncbi:MAG: hypothetical protein R3C69_05215 [Geminicoccaceae bacterium]
MPAIVQRLAGSAARERVGRVLLGPPLPAAMPQRVADAIGREQARSEVLVSLIQLGAIVLFAVLYSFTPKAFPPDVPFEPVPIALVLYALFTFWRLSLALKERLTRPVLAVSVVVDIALLMVTIWSFHLQYQAPPALYLKAPTLMYVFILIALRTLRFEPAFVILAGVSAAGLAGARRLCGALRWRAAGGPHDHAELRRVHDELQHPDRRRGRQDRLDPHGDGHPRPGPPPGSQAPRAGRARGPGSIRSQALLRAGDRRADHGKRWRARARPRQLREAAIMFIDLRGFTALGERSGAGRGDAAPR